MDFKIMANFHCPRWNELPDIDLYMDQVVNILDRNLGCFASDNTKIVTSTMINNYVKQKVVKPPKNKKYDRVHLAYLIPVCILKQVLSISELCRGISVILKHMEIPDAYNYFCELLETALKNVFSGKELLLCTKEDTDDKRILKSVINCFVTLQYTHYLIEKIDE